MGLFHKKLTLPYDPAAQEPAVRKSICTGEMTVGFIDKATGRFHEYMLVRTPAELEAFRHSMGVEELRTIY